SWPFTWERSSPTGRPRPSAATRASSRPTSVRPMSADAAGADAIEASGLDVLYGDYQVLWDVSFHARRGEVVAILGPNGSGKSTLMNTLSGLVRGRSGEIRLGERRIDGLPPHKIVGLGLAHVLERRRLFPYLTVRQNLLP